MNNEDEAICFSLKSTQYNTDVRNDLIPDEKDSSDEEIYINLLTSVRKEVDDVCDPVDQVPCLKGHPACYVIDKMCLYDHTQDGRLKYCRNGFHLLECEHFQCSGSFKCQHSYCVPTYKVCNGVQDNFVMVYKTVHMEMMKSCVQCWHVLTCCDVVKDVFILKKYVTELCTLILVRMSLHMVPQTALQHVSVVAMP